MAGLIPQAFIDELISRTNIVEVVNARVPLKKAGRDYKACCPFHDEKSPSFTVSESKQFYYCFGCGAKGNAVGFLMEYDRLEFPDAVDELARMAGMEVPREAGQRRPDGIEDIYGVLAEAEQTYMRELKKSPDAVAYLKQRGIDGDTARTFRLGYAPDRWDTLAATVGSDRQRHESLLKAGLVGTRKDGGLYDKFRARIIFPIHDSRGRPIAFGGRIMAGDDGPKYLNSPETVLFHKGSQLYGLYQVRQAVAHPARLLVVEGYMDVIALAQFGLPECVATLGTATTTEHAELLFRNAAEVVFCFDGDAAGQRAAQRAMASVLPRLRDGRVARFLFLSDGEDPDSLIRKEGQSAFTARLDRATPLSDVFFSSHQAEVDMSSLDGRARLVELCRPELEQIPDGAFRDMMFERLAQLAASERAVRSGPVERSPAVRRTPGPAARRPSLIRRAITMLVHHPSLGASPAPVERLLDLDRPGIALLVELFQWCRSHPGSVTAHVLEHWAERSDYRHLEKLAREPSVLPEPEWIEDPERREAVEAAWSTALEAEFAAAVEGLLAELERGQLARLEQRIEAVGMSGLSAEEKASYRQWQKQRGAQNAKES